jgi:hypothetical protein
MEIKDYFLNICFSAQKVSEKKNINNLKIISFQIIPTTTTEEVNLKLA